jgi:hypothetical protein
MAKVYSEKWAAKNGYATINSDGYSPDIDEEIFRKALQDVKGTDYILVRSLGKIWIYRKARELAFARAEVGKEVINKNRFR